MARLLRRWQGHRLHCSFRFERRFLLALGKNERVAFDRNLAELVHHRAGAGGNEPAATIIGSYATGAVTGSNSNSVTADSLGGLVGTSTGAISDSFATNEQLLAIIIKLFERGEFNKIRLANKAIAHYEALVEWV